MFFWAVFFFTFRIISACPTSCVCRWKGGKQTVECVDKGLITIPDGMDQGTQVLDFTGNNLNELPRERFQRMGITNLQKIYLPRCKISQIDDRAFRGLTNLVELDLSENLISTVPTETFLDFKSLMRLTLSRNPIRHLKSSSFKPLGFLTSLELSHCQMERIDDEAFTGLEKLEWLKLDNNRLQNIKGSNILPDKLHELDLQNNPWICDCKMIDLRNWLTKYNVPQSSEPKCTGPSRVRGYGISTLEVNDLACLPDVTPTTLYLEIAEGKNVSLLCRVTAIPEAKVTWWFQGNILQNDSLVAPGLHLYYYIEEGTVEKRSELFIFNTNVEDNGTFLCIAENPAGKSQSNYTIRIVLKEETLVGLAVIPYEYVILISGGVSIVALFLVLFIVLCIVRCRKQRRRKKKKDRSKAIALQNQQSFSKAGLNTSEHMTRIGTTPVVPKVNGSVEREQAMLYTTGTTVLVVPNNLQLQNYESQNSLRNYVEQNPDLLNDMENGKEKRSLALDVYDNIGLINYHDAMNNVLNELENKQSMQVPQQWLGSRELYQGNAECHGSPRKYIGKDGYPLDYGLPKISIPVMPSGGFYRTLPHKRQNAANPSSRYSREAEFLSKSIQPASYEHYNSSDVRYTVEGYPRQHSDLVVSFDNFLVPSPPAPYTDKLPKDASAQWPETIPESDPLGMSQCSVGAQTTSDVLCKNSFPSNPLHHLQPVLTESPDEGYEGETTDATEI